MHSLTLPLVYAQPHTATCLCTASHCHLSSVNVGFQCLTQSPCFGRRYGIRVDPSSGEGTTRTLNRKIVARGDPGNNCDIPVCVLSVCRTPVRSKDHDFSVCKLFGLRVFFVCFWLRSVACICILYCCPYTCSCEIWQLYRKNGRDLRNIWRLKGIWNL